MEFILFILLVLDVFPNDNIGATIEMTGLRGIRLFGKYLVPGVPSSASSPILGQGERGTAETTAEKAGAASKISGLPSIRSFGRYSTPGYLPVSSAQSSVHAERVTAVKVGDTAKNGDKKNINPEQYSNLLEQRSELSHEMSRISRLLNFVREQDTLVRLNARKEKLLSISRLLDTEIRKMEKELIPKSE